MDFFISNLDQVYLFIFFLFSFLFGCSMYGWGSLILSNSLINYVSLTVVAGMATTLFFGGILNFLSLANKFAINFIFIFGLFIFIFNLIKKKYFSKFLDNLRNFKKNYVIFLFPLCLLTITCITSINPEAYNIHDDYQKYFIYPIKMLETGSVFGSKLGAIGQETLGGQAFFQSFFVSWLGIKSINIFDSVFCVIVSTILIIEYAVKNKVILFGALVLSLFILIHPQYVNTSSLYSASLFMMSCLILSSFLFNENEKIDLFNFKNILTISLLFSSLVVLKSSYAIFPILFFFLFSIFFILLKNSYKYKFSIIILIPVLSIFFFLPWASILIDFYTSNPLTSNEPMKINLPWVKPSFSDIFSTTSLFYGGTYLNYSSTLIISLFLILTIILTTIFNKKFIFEQKIIYLSLLSIFSGFIITAIIIFFGSKLAHFTSLIRLSIPFIISTVSISLISAYVLIKNGHNFYKFAAISITLILCILHFPQYLNIVDQSYKCGSKISFKDACLREYADYNKKVLNGDKRLSINNWQKEIPKNEKIMAWINTPFLLDFKRNEIHEISIVGFNNPWTVFPSAKYLMVEHSGFATRSNEELINSSNNDYLFDRKISIRTIQHLIKINQLIKTGKARIIKRDNSIIILQIEGY